MVYQVAKILRAKFMDTEIHNAKFLFFGVRTIDMQLKLYCFERERKEYALLCALALWPVCSTYFHFMCATLRLHFILTIVSVFNGKNVCHFSSFLANGCYFSTSLNFVCTI